MQPQYIFFKEKGGRNLKRLAGIQFPEYYSKLASNIILLYIILTMFTTPRFADIMKSGLKLR